MFLWSLKAILPSYIPAVNIEEIASKLHRNTRSHLNKCPHFRLAPGRYQSIRVQSTAARSSDVSRHATQTLARVFARLPNRPLSRLWGCSNLEYRTIRLFYRSENFLCFVLQFGYIPTDVNGVYWVCCKNKSHTAFRSLYSY